MKTHSFLNLAFLSLLLFCGVLHGQNTRNIAGVNRIVVDVNRRILQEDAGSTGIITSKISSSDDFAVFILEPQSDGAYRVKVKGSNLYWHVDSNTDEFLSTRFQPNDDHTHFFFEPQTDGTYRIRLKATNKYLHEDGNGDKVLSTRFQPNDGHTRFRLQPPPPPAREFHNLSVLTYNVMLLDRASFRNHRQNFRAEEIPAAFSLSRGEQLFDVVVFNEAFDNESRDILTRRMAQSGYPFATSVVDVPGNFEDGGVFIQSPHFIEAQDQIVFSSASGFDGLANKGAAYARITKGGRRIHVFGTHLQADDEPSVRNTQINELKAFIDSKVPEDTDDIVLVAGDLNFDVSSSEYANALATLDARDINRDHSFRSFDPVNNLLTKYRYEGEPAQLYDYIFSLNRGGSPIMGIGHLQKFQTPFDYNIPAVGDPLGILDDGTDLRDLSDHYGFSVSFRYR